MKNLDLIQKENAAVLQRMQQAVKDNDTDAFGAAFGEFAMNLQKATLEDAKELITSNDAGVLAQRGVRALTSEETAYYQKVIDAMRSSNPKQALADLSNVLPKTTIDAVFDDLTAQHPLLDLVDFQNTGALIDIITSTSTGVAAWGELTATINSELAAAFAVLPLTNKKLSAFIPVAKSMLDLGPAWLDRYVRTLLVEALATALEAGIVDGDGDDAPLGMTRALSGAVDGAYPRKSAVTVTQLDSATYGSILNTLSQGPNGKRRAVVEVVMLVNPADYFTKVLPATTVRTTDGGFNTNAFPFPTRVVQSAAVPSGHALFSLPKLYRAFLGTGKGGRLEYDDSYRFLEDQRVYLIKLYGTGRPADANAFVYADISGLVGTTQRVFVTNADEFPVADVPAYPDARLASLAIGSLTLDPTFNKSVFVYEAATTNATNTITAVAKDGEATVAILVNDVAHVNGTAATWAEGANTVDITVTKDGETETYSVAVTKGA